MAELRSGQIESLDAPAEATSETSLVFPPILRTELATPALAPRPWYLAVAPTYLGLFVWGPFFDQLWMGDLAVSSGMASWRGNLASVLCYSLFYHPLAWWGFRTRQRLSILAASTFGTVGSEWITGVGIAVASIVWYAVAVNYAIDSTLLGLHSCGLIERSSLSGLDLGPVALKSPVFLCTALFWIYITGMSSLWRLTGVVVALMRVYAPVALLLLTATAFWFLPNLGSFHAENLGYHRQQIDLVARGACRFFSDPAHHWLLCHGGTDERRLGGCFAKRSRSGPGRHDRDRAGVILDGIDGSDRRCGTVASIGLPSRPSAMMSGDPLPLSFRWGVFYGIGGYWAGAILILFGLAASRRLVTRPGFLDSGCRLTGLGFANRTGRGSAARWPLC